MESNLLSIPKIDGHQNHESWTENKEQTTSDFLLRGFQKQCFQPLLVLIGSPTLRPIIKTYRELLIFDAA